MIVYKAEVPTQVDFAYLFEITGWNHVYQATPEDLLEAFTNRWYVLSAYDDEKLVGFGRLVFDKILHAMIYELIVLPEYRCQGIGSKILNRLIQSCQQAGIHDIQLFSARGKRAFYEKRGFTARPDDAPGMQYRSGANT